MSLLSLSRWQFAITVMFHMTFPAITVGVSILLCVLYGMYWKTQRLVYLQMFRFWRRIFGIASISSRRSNSLIAKTKLRSFSSRSRSAETWAQSVMTSSLR